jgi:GNAT superfamily N-acetyltransferase
MIVRPATPEDVPAILPMVARICAFHERLDPAKYGFVPGVTDMYRDWLIARSTDPQSVFFVADPGGDDSRRLAGFLIGTVEREIPIYRIERFGFIHDLWIDEKYRNEGTARQMVSLAIERFRDIGVPQVRLDVAFGNQPAKNLFAACGFRPAVIEMLHDFQSPSGK